MSDTATRRSPAGEAFELMHDLFVASKPRFHAIASEFELAPMQCMLLRHLAPGEARPMGDFASWLACDSSNVTGIVDRLESRGLVERRAAAGDRRVKLIALTDEGVAVRAALMDRWYEPPPELAALPAADQRALRDLLARALR